jgi:hypothetical protein
MRSTRRSSRRWWLKRRGGKTKDSIAEYLLRQIEKEVGNRESSSLELYSVSPIG